MLNTRIAVTSVLAAAAVLATAGAASATPHPAPVSVHAVTILADRPDGGNGSPDPYWADDSFARILTITRTGGSPGDWTYTASLSDAGTFTTIKGAQAPNQAAPYAGEVIRSRVTGIMTGFADFSFTASTLPEASPNAGVPLYENDHGAVPSDGTSTWYELAFPSGTVFGGAGIGHWSWTYAVNVVRFPFVSHQQWVDGWSNNYGDSAGDGQITG